jgi:hypothetical protein
VVLKTSSSDEAARAAGALLPALDGIREAHALPDSPASRALIAHETNILLLLPSWPAQLLTRKKPG